MAVNGIIGKKVGMTQIFTAEGTVVPVTVVQAGPCLVIQKKTAEKDGYDALQIGFVGSRPERRANKAARGRFERAGVAPMRTLMEVRADEGDELKPGDKVLCDTFS
jgi:large subunit ribosomal protein L3